MTALAATQTAQEPSFVQISTEARKRYVSAAGEARKVLDERLKQADRIEQEARAEYDRTIKAAREQEQGVVLKALDSTWDKPSRPVRAPRTRFKAT